MPLHPTPCDPPIKTFRYAWLGTSGLWDGQTPPQPFYVSVGPRHFWYWVLRSCDAQRYWCLGQRIESGEVISTPPTSASQGDAENLFMRCLL